MTSNSSRRSLPKIPLVSIIIPCYNPGDRIVGCLASCLAQTYSRIEVIVVDNQSTDSSIKYVHATALGARTPVKVVCCEKRGAPSARITGFDCADGDILLWIDADDELHPDAVKMHVETFSRYPAVSLVSTGPFIQRHLIGGVGMAEFRVNTVVSSDMMLRLLLNDWQPMGAWAMDRASIERLHSLNAWLPHLTAWNERHFLICAVMTGVAFVCTPEALMVHHRWSGSQLSRSVARARRHYCIAEIIRSARDLAKHLSFPLTTDHRFLLEIPRGLLLPRVNFRGKAPPLDSKGDRGQSLVSRVLLNPQFWTDPSVHLDLSGNTLEWYGSLLTRQLWEMARAECIYQHSDPMAAALNRYCDMLGLDSAEAPMQENIPLSMVEFYPKGLPLLINYRLPVIKILKKLYCEDFFQEIPFPNI